MPALPFAIYTHDAWGAVQVGAFATLAEAQAAFSALCADPWYQQDGGVKGLELVQSSAAGTNQRLDWHGFGPTSCNRR